MEIFHSITWGQFFAAIGVVSTLYYLYIGIRYFRGDLRKILPSPKDKDPLKKEGEKKKKQTSVILTEDQFVEAFKELEQIAHDLRCQIIPGYARSKDWKTMLHRIAQRLEDYQGFIVPAFRYALFNHVMSEAAKSLIPLKEEALQKTWEEILSRQQELNA